MIPKVLWVQNKPKSSATVLHKWYEAFVGFCSTCCRASWPNIRPKDIVLEVLLFV